MTRAITFLALLKKAAPSALMFLVIAVFGGYALMGSNGVLAWGDYKRQLAERKLVLAKLERDKAVLANRVTLLDPRKANPDLVDEYIRRDMGLAHPDEVILELK